MRTAVLDALVGIFSVAYRLVINAYPRNLRYV